MATGTKEFLCPLILHLVRLYLRPDANNSKSEIRLGLLQGPSYIQTVKVVQSAVGGFAAHLDNTLLCSLLLILKVRDQLTKEKVRTDSIKH